ncbi:MAG: hypothetical protein K5659_04220 [Lachnospiraceae bacterium]|nr:hypothetical protein [Lachnospiraceae bacterium]
MKKKLLAVLIGVMCLGAAVACNQAEDVVEEVVEGEVGEVEEQVTEEVEEAAEEVVEEVTEDEEMPTAEEEYEAVKATLTYMGGLYAVDENCDLQIALFRNTDGDIVTVITEGGAVVDYGFATNEDAETEDGTAYTKIIFGDNEYGYTFDEDLTTGLVINKDGASYKANALDEEEAFAMVKSTIVVE